MNQAQAVELTRRYQRRLAATTDQAGAALSKMWDDLGSWGDADVDRFAAKSTPVTTAAQRSVVAVTAGYLSLLIASPPVAIDPTRFAGLVDARSPFLAYWSALKSGQKWTDAITSGRTAAEGLGSTAVQSAARGTSGEVDQKEQRIVGWSRVLVGPSCEFCATAAVQRYHSAESANFGHDRCDCTVVPVTGDVNPGRTLNAALYDNLKNLGDDATGYVSPDGTPAERPALAAVEAP